jgi:hypothetical protein
MANMNALIYSIKNETSSFFKKLFRKTHDTEPDSTYAPAKRPTVEAAAASSSSSYSCFGSAPVRKPLGVEISLQKILAGLPVELQPRIRQANVGQQTIAVRLEKILPQLSKGAVKVAFGELRQTAPGVFSAENDQDQVTVALPLGDILSQLSPAFITRRRTQRQVEVPTDISSPFDLASREFTLQVNVASETASPGIAPKLEVKPVPTAPVAAPASASLAPISPAIPLRQSPSAPAPIPLVVPKAEATVPSRVPPAVPPTAPIAMPSPIRGRVNGYGAPSAVASSSEAAPAKSAALGEPLLLAIGELAEGWPEVVRKEIVGLNLEAARVALPAGSVERGLKQGKIAFTWKTIRSWVESAVSATVSPHDDCMLDLPLKLIVPLFMARQRQATKTKQEVCFADDIPNPFSRFLKAEAPTSAPEAQPSDTKDSAGNNTQEILAVHKSEVVQTKPAAKAVAKCVTPNDVVSRAAALEGVAGVLIALPDGLMVANRLPADLNADNLAAFLPQIYGKFSQCTKEFRMGELNDLNFTVGNIPWKILRGNTTFFGAFGRAGEPLPKAQLAALAAELDHKTN